MKSRNLIESIGEIENVLHWNKQPENLPYEVMMLVAKAIGCDSAIITYLKDDDLEIQRVFNFDQSVIGVKKSLKDQPVANLALSEKKLQIVEDVLSEYSVIENSIINSGIKSSVVLPLYTTHLHIGVIYFNFLLKVRFSRETIIYLNHISSTLSIALENARLIKDLQSEVVNKTANEIKLLHLNRILVILSNCSNLMINAESECEYLNQICQTVIRESDLALVWIGFIRNKTIKPEYYYGEASGYIKELSIKTNFGPSSHGPTGCAVRAKEAVVCNNVEESTFRLWADKAKAFNIKSSSSFPIIIRDEIIGVINLYSYKTDYFTSEEILLFSELAKYISQGITTIRYENIKKEVQLSLRESEEQFRMLAHKSNAIILQVDASGKILYSNEKFYQTIATNPILLEGFNLIIRQLNSMVYNVEADHSISDSNGTEKWFSFHKSSLINTNGAMRISYIVFDITVKKETETRLVLQTRELQNLNATKDKFFGIIAHDLKNPFTGILGASELMSENTGRIDLPKTQKLAAVIHDSATRGFALLQNLLEWSRSQTGQISFVPSNLKLNALFEECLGDVLIAANRKKLKISIHNQEDLVLYADKNMICTILRNLVHNAIKYSWENSTIIISARAMDSEAVIMVKDEGIGITTENLDKLFRIDAGFTTPGTKMEQGTGLGLLLCNEFVKKHNGRIWVESEQDKGCSFYFAIPLAILIPAAIDYHS
jgi:signal transduction histidine kinase